MCVCVCNQAVSHVLPCPFHMSFLHIRCNQAVSHFTPCPFHMSFLQIRCNHAVSHVTSSCIAFAESAEWSPSEGATASGFVTRLQLLKVHSQDPPSSSHLGEMRAGTQSPSGVLATLPVDGLAGSATQEAWEGAQRSSDIPLARDVLVASWGRYPRTGGEDLKTSTHYLGAECVLHQLGAAPNSRAKWEREEPTPLVKKTLESSDFQGRRT